MSDVFQFNLLCDFPALFLCLPMSCLSISTGCIYSVCPLMSSLLSFVTHLCVLYLSHLPALFHWASSSDSLLAIVFFLFVPCIFTGLWSSLSSSGIRGPSRHNIWFPAAGITGPSQCHSSYCFRVLAGLLLGLKRLSELGLDLLVTPEFGATEDWLRHVKSAPQWSRQKHE